jgi:hypothetical protein
MGGPAVEVDGLHPVLLKSQVVFGESNMPISADLLAILACPVCKTPVNLLPNESGLQCETCRRIYPVRDGIPVMLPEEATIPAE